MKGLKSAIVTFLIGSLGAGYIALAPFGQAVTGADGAVMASAIDAPAIALIHYFGRTNAVLALLVGGALLSLALMVLANIPDRKRASAPRARPASNSARQEPKHAVPPPSPPLQSRSTSERVEAMRRRAVAEAQVETVTPFNVTTADAEHAVANAAANSSPEPLPAPRPVMLVRKARERDRDWREDTTWFGGLPRLGNVPWPADDDGKPLPFAAQVDLALIAAACPESPLPKSGSLAFFLGPGAVVHVPGNGHEFTSPPTSLLPAYDEGGLPFPQHATRLSRPVFRFWPAEPVGLDMPEDMRFLVDERRHSEITDTMYDLLDAKVPERSEHFPDDEPHVDGSDDLWWFAVRHLSDRLHVALTNADRRLSDTQRAVDAVAATVAAHEAVSDNDPALIDSARASLVQAQARFDNISIQRAALPEMVAAVDGFAENRSPWERLTHDEAEVVVEILNECLASYPDLVRYHLPHSIKELHALCVREMMTGDAAAIAALPESILDFRNRRHRLTGAIQHQMFGLGACQQHALYDHLTDLLLLQLAYDADMDWLFGNMGLFQFWISPDDAAAERWDKVELTFEMS